MGILRETWTVMECMHRFCGECIQRCLRGGKQECPSCRQHVGSKRSLRRDTNFDQIIEKVLQNVDAHERAEAKREKAFYRVKAAKVTEELNIGMKRQDENRIKMRYWKPKFKTKSKKRKVPSRGSSSSSSSSSGAGNRVKRTKKMTANFSGGSGGGGSSSSSSSSSSSRRSAKKKKKKKDKKDKKDKKKRPDKKDKNGKKGKKKKSRASSSVDLNYRRSAPDDPRLRDARFHLKRDPKSENTPQLLYPWLNTSSSIQIFHIKKYLSRKLAAQGLRHEPGDFQVYLDIRSTRISLSDASTFSDIQAVWPADQAVVLHYACSPTN